MNLSNDISKTYGHWGLVTLVDVCEGGCGIVNGSIDISKTSGHWGLVTLVDVCAGVGAL